VSQPSPVRVIVANREPIQPERLSSIVGGILQARAKLDKQKQPAPAVVPSHIGPRCSRCRKYFPINQLSEWRSKPRADGSHKIVLYICVNCSAKQPIAGFSTLPGHSDTTGRTTEPVPSRKLSREDAGVSRQPRGSAGDERDTSRALRSPA